MIPPGFNRGEKLSQELQEELQAWDSSSQTPSSRLGTSLILTVMLVGVVVLGFALIIGSLA